MNHRNSKTKHSHPSSLTFYELLWQRPFALETVQAILGLLAETRPRGAVILEVRVSKGKINYYIGCNGNHAGKVKNCFARLTHVRFKVAAHSVRQPIAKAKRLRISKPNLALNVDLAESILRASLAALATVPKEETAVVQIILGAAYRPSNVPKHIEDPNTTWMDRILGQVREASADTLKSMREKASQYSFDAIIRVGATGNYASYYISSICSALQTMSASGVKVGSTDVDPTELNLATTPWQFPLRLSVKELSVLTLYPFGEETLPGVSGLHPKTLLPPDWYHSPLYPNSSRIFATSHDDKLLSISPKDSLEHTVVLGPTGSGKSTVMLDLVMQDIKSGRSVMVIDPKADFVTDILARIPDERLDDVVVIDPSDSKPVGFNPLKVHKGQDPSLTADAILSVFQELFSENWGIRSQDTLSAALLTLAETKDATLMWLPTLLTDSEFRDKITKNLKDQIALVPFWKQFNELKDSERRTIIESTLNKIRQLMFRPNLRNVLGQSNPKFDLMDLFYQRKIVLVPLNKGLIGADSAKFLGSLLVGLTWVNALSRASIPAEKRHIVSLYIDELQDYLNLPTSFSDALAQARGLGLSITVAHQYRAQLDPDIRAGIDANCRNKISFGLQATDAGALASQSNGELETEDFTLLPRYHIYTNFMSGKKQTGWISGITRPPTEPIRLPAEAKAISQARYGKPVKEVEAEILKAINISTRSALTETKSSATLSGYEVRSAPEEIKKQAVGRKKV